METRARLHPDVQIIAPPAGLFDAGELRDDELDQAVGGLERAWIPASVENDARNAANPALTA